MIPGDIDLTENLDFRNVKKRELPQLPASWDGKDRLNTAQINSNNIITTYSTTNGSWTLRYGDGYFEPITVSDITLVNNDDELELISHWSYNYEWHSNSINSTIINNQYYDLYFNYDSTTTTSNKTRLNISYEEDEFDIFGNRIKPTPVIPQIPWKEKKEYDVYTDPICWEKHERKWIRHNEDYIPPIPWDDEEDDYVEQDLSSPYKRAKNLICWLRNKSKSFIERYFDTEDEEVDMSYLTNMSWIRVHDAVIDSI